MNKNEADIVMEATSENKPDITEVDSLPYVDGDESHLKVNHFLIPILTMEILILVCLALLAYYLRFTDEFPVFEGPIFCNDETLKFAVGNPSAIFELDSKVLYTISFLLPIATIALGELCYWIFSVKPRKSVGFHCSSCRISLTTRRLLRFSGTFILGALCTSIITDGMKLMSGRPRPYFFSICDPDGTSCSLSVSKIINGSNPCSNKDTDQIRYARLSFPSFYASLSSYAATYTMIYLHNILRMHGTYALRPLLLLITGGLSMLAGFSRIMNNENHWQDVATGFAIGSTIAAYFAILIMNNFQEHKNKSKPEIIISPRPEDNSRFFRWFWIPRISFGKNSSSSFRGVYSNGKGGKGPFGPNPAFQQDLHRRIENFGRKQKKSDTAVVMEETSDSVPDTRID